MKINSNLISLILKLVGGILIISVVLDYIFDLIPSQWQDLNWQVNLINGFIDQGIAPLIGICFILIGWWIEDSKIPKKPNSGLRIFVLTISCILGVFFLLLIPLHMNNISQISSNLNAQIDRQVAQQEAQLQGFIAQLETVSKDPERLRQEIAQRTQVLESGGILEGQQLNAQQLQLLSNQREQLQQILDLSQNPEQLKGKLEEVKTNLQTELQTKESEERSKARKITLQQSLKTSLGSLVLAIAYSAIGWFGFREVSKLSS